MSAAQLDDKAQRDRKILLELKIELRIRELEVMAARLWLDLARRADQSPLGWLQRAAERD